MVLYQLTLFYKNLAGNAAEVRRIRSEIEAIAGKNWRVLSAAEQVCAIVFQTDAEHKSLQDRFASYGSEQLQFLLVEVSAVHGGYLLQGAFQWIGSRLPRKQ